MICETVCPVLIPKYFSIKIIIKKSAFYNFDMYVLTYIINHSFSYIKILLSISFDQAIADRRLTL